MDFFLLTHLGHPGIKRTSDTMIALHYYHPCLSARCEDLISHCNACQRNKPALRGYDELPPHNTVNTAWQEVAIDLIGPWTFTVHGASYTFRALTMIDTATNYCELIRINNKSAAHVGQKFENEWLSWYPCPQSCIYDQGNEFLGFRSQQHLHRYNIHSKVSTVKNPQSNAVTNAYIKRSPTFYVLPSMLTFRITNWRQNSSLTLLCKRPPMQCVPQYTQP